MTWKSLLRLVRTYRYAPWFTAAVLAVLVGFLLLQRACGGRPSPVGKIITAEPLNYYDPDFLYEIPQRQKWVQTGEIRGVPTVEPADEETRRLVETALGDEADEVDFLFVGEVGKLPEGADVFIVQDKELDGEIDYGDLPRAVTKEGVEFPIGPPPRLLIRPKPKPTFDLKTLHRAEAAWEWDPSRPDAFAWKVEYRPYEFWVRGRVYGFVEVGYQQRAGESGVLGRAGFGVCTGRDC